MLVYAMVPREFHASYYYRHVVPLETMQQLGLGMEWLKDRGDPELADHQRLIAMTHADVHLSYQISSQPALNHFKTVQRWKACRDRDGNWKWPPSLVIDTDDNMFDVHAMNPAYQRLGYRAPDGTELKDGDQVWTMSDSSEPEMRWADGQRGFDVARNKKTVDLFRQICVVADAVTCSTPRIAAILTAEAKPREILVFPNSVRFDHYPDVELRDHPGEIRILWQGSETHAEDWYALRHAIGHVTRKHPQVKWVVWGVLYRWATEVIPNDRLTFIPWCDYAQYKLRLCTIGHDINLAPLKNTRFNQGRSAIKWYESSAIGRPAATLAQATGTYADEIEPYETGLLFNTPADMTERLSELIEDEALRQRLAANAKDWVNENRDAFKTVPKLHQFYAKLRDRKQSEVPKMSEEEIAAMQAEMEEEEREIKARQAGAQAGALEGTDALAR